MRDGGRNPDKQLQNGVYRIKDGKTTLVLRGADLGGTPNGVALSPDGKWMYLSTANRQMRRLQSTPMARLPHLPSLPKASGSVTARRPTAQAICSQPAALAPACVLRLIYGMYNRASTKFRPPSVAPI